MPGVCSGCRATQTDPPNWRTPPRGARRIDVDAPGKRQGNAGRGIFVNAQTTEHFVRRSNPRRPPNAGGECREAESFCPTSLCEKWNPTTSEFATALGASTRTHLQKAREWGQGNIRESATTDQFGRRGPAATRRQNRFAIKSFCQNGVRFFCDHSPAPHSLAFRLAGYERQCPQPQRGSVHHAKRIHKDREWEQRNIRERANDRALCRAHNPRRGSRPNAGLIPERMNPDS